MNTLKDTQDAIQNAAERHGFRWEAPAHHNFLPRIVSEDMNFLITPTVSPDSDWMGGKVRIDIAVCASVRRMSCSRQQTKFVGARSWCGNFRAWTSPTSTTSDGRRGSRHHAAAAP